MYRLTGVEVQYRRLITDNRVHCEIVQYGPLSTSELADRYTAKYKDDPYDIDDVLASCERLEAEGCVEEVPGGWQLDEQWYDDLRDRYSEERR